MNNKGFGLVEILVVVVLVGIIVVVIANLSSPIKLLGVSQDDSLAKEIVAKQLEVVRNVGYLNLGSIPANITDSRLSQLNNGSGTTLIEDCLPPICTNNEQAKKVTITVSWSESGKTRKVEAATLVSEGGLK